MRHNDYSTAPKPSVSRSSSHRRPTKAAQFSTLFSIGRSMTSYVAQVFLVFFSDHRPVLVTLSCRSSRFPSIPISFRRLRDIDPEAFVHDIKRLNLITDPSDALDCLLAQYNDGLRSLIDKHVPVVTKNVVLCPSAPWITEATRQTKRAKRRAERTWLKRRLTVHLELYRDKRRQHYYLLASERTSYVWTKVADCRGDSKKIFSLVNSLMGTVPNRDSEAVAAAKLAYFFETKVSQIRFGLDTAADDAGLSPIQPHIPSPVADPSTRLADFRQLTTEDVRELISSSPNKSCCLDPIPTVLLKRFIDFLVSPITAILNLSLSSGIFPSALKNSSISPLLKKPNLDPDDPNS